jgi:phosphoglucomutase
MDEDDARALGLFNIIGTDFDDKYIAQVKAQSIHPEIIPEMAKDMKIVYTPLHGTGNVPVRRVLKDLGFTQVYVEPQQKIPDGSFPTVAYPNPEDPKAWELALKLANEVDADIVLATDPDADRLGVYAKDTKTGKYVSFTGNMSGMLIAEYIFREKLATGTMPENPALVTTIVTTDLAKAIAAEYNARCIEVLTGFKYIGEQIKIFEETGCNNYVFGLEESYGCLTGTYARDKDSIVAVMMLCEVAAFCKKEGKTLWDAMIEMYEDYGYYKEGQYSITMKGIEGAKEIAALMDKLRNDPPKTFGQWTVEEFRDYKTGETVNPATGEKGKTGLPSSNVLYFALDNDSWCCARPSGTEPKIKFYMGVKGTSLDDADQKQEELTAAVKALIEK